LAAIGRAYVTLAREYHARFARRGVVRHDTLDVALSHQFRSHNRHLVDQQVSASAEPDDVLVETCVTRDHHAATVVVDTIAVGRFDDVAVIDLEGDHSNSIFLIDRAIVVELLNVHCNSFGRKLLVRGPDLDISRISLLKIYH
jgi:hypothetical protein